MGSNFRSVDILIFDFHLALRPLLADNALKPEVAFLNEPGAYRTQFTSDKPITAGGLHIRPLSAKTRNHHHFWKHYSNTFAPFDPWSLLLPFVCEPVQHNWSIAPPSKGAGASANAAIYLYPFGWSTTIEISVEGARTASQLRDYVSSLRSSDKGPFVLDGKAASLADLQRHFGSLVKKACFPEEDAAPELMKVSRHFVISLSRFEGQSGYYRPGWGSQMVTADRADLHSILLGTPVSPADVVQRETNHKFSLTEYNHGQGIALTYFEWGTLLFMQDRAKDAARRPSMRCLATNILHCTQTLVSLLKFYSQSETQSAASNTTIGQMREAARQGLFGVRDRYWNRYRKVWFENGPLKDLTPQD